MATKRLICFVLLLVMSVACFAGCQTEIPDESSTPSSAVSVETSDEVSENPDKFIETKEFAGETIKVYTAAFNDSYVTEIGDNAGNENCAEVLSLAIKNRTEAVEDAYGVTIEETILIDPKRYGGTFLQAVREFAVSLTGDYDIYYPCLLDAGTMAAEGLLTDLASAPGIRIQNSWWDQTFIKDTSIGGGTYYLTGDIGLRAKNASGCLYFNKKLFDDFGLQYPYNTVREMKWTIDEILSLIRTADMSDDTDGDQKITYHDTFGWAGQNGDMQKLFYGSGERITAVDESGTPYISVYNERSARVVDKIITLLQDPEEYVCGDDYFNESSTPMVLLLASFKADQCLFYSGGMEDALKLGDMESDFGILPTPMFDEAQGQYYTQVGAWSSNAYCIPYGLSDEQTYRAEVILDALGAYSVDTVAKTYYDVVLQYQKLRTDDDVEMLEIIFDNTGADLGDVYKIGGLSSMLTSLISQPSGTFASSYDALENSAIAALDDLIATFESNVKN
ncbi:MAG: hypothetical protein IJD82_00815 [Clostridia bacterium]|nr:hypothetical protein [Clostridia bacterium]